MDVGCGEDDVWRGTESYGRKGESRPGHRQERRKGGGDDLISGTRLILR